VIRISLEVEMEMEMVEIVDGIIGIIIGYIRGRRW